VAVLDEIETPDLWAELKVLPQILATANETDAENAPFAPGEQDEISRVLGEIRRLVQKQAEQGELTTDQLSSMEQRLDYAERAARRLGRKDWLVMFYTLVTNTIVTDAVPQNLIHTILTTAIHGIGHLFGFGGGPPIITT
jgi:hypothetical protein